MKKLKLVLKKLFCKVNNNPNDKLIKSFVAVGDVIEVLHYNKPEIYKVENFEVKMNGLYSPTEFVIYVVFSYNDGVSTIGCTSDSFKYIRHISHC